MREKGDDEMRELEAQGGTEVDKHVPMVIVAAMAVIVVVVVVTGE